jgi:hypothetical protein
VTMVISALIVELVFGVAGLIPTRRPTDSDIFGSVQVDYTLFLDIFAAVVFAVLLWLSIHRPAAAVPAEHCAAHAPG